MVMLSGDFVKVSFCNLRIIYLRILLKKNLIEKLCHLQRGKITRANFLVNFLLPNLINARSTNFQQN